MMSRLFLAPLLSACLASGLAGEALAADTPPEIQRQPTPPQAIGEAHTLRTIPEACARLEGRFTGTPASPYALTAVASSARCMPRAQLVDADKARPSVARGWILNDVIRVPSASCPTQQAVVRIWRTDVPEAARRDAQGRVRVYLRDSMAPGGAPRRVALQRYAASLAVIGKACPG